MFSFKIIRYSNRSFPGVAGVSGPLFLLIAGQSNAVGFGTSGNGGPGASDVPNYLTGIMPNAFYWRNQQTGNGSPYYGWSNYQCGINSEPSTSNTGAPSKWGPEAQFAYEWTRDNPGQTIWMCKSAVAGSQLEDTSVIVVSGAPAIGWCATSTGQDFSNTTSVVAAALTGMSGSGITSFNSAILWMQGESDGQDSFCASGYYNNLKQFITSGRTYWNLGSNVFYSIGRITEPSWPYAAGVRMGESVNAVNLPYIGMVNTDSYPLAPDVKHYTASGQVLLGDAMYQTYKTYYSNPAGPYGAGVTMPTGYSFTINEQPANGTVIGAASGVSTNIVTPVYDLYSGQYNGLTINDDTAVISVGDGTQLAYSNGANRIFLVRGCNGINIAYTMVTLNLIQNSATTDVSNTVFRIDPNNATYYLVSNGKYTGIYDTEHGTGFAFNSTSSRQPQVVPYGGGSNKSGIFFPITGNVADLSTTYSGIYISNTGQNYTIAAVVTPIAAGGSGSAATIGSVFVGVATTRYSLYYNFPAQVFGITADLQSNGASSAGASVNTFPPGYSYRVRAVKQGSTVNLYVNETLQTLTGFGSNIIRAQTMATGETGALGIGGDGPLAGSFYGTIGLMRFIDGNPTISEVSFLNNELGAWGAGYTTSGLATGIHGTPSSPITVKIAVGTFSGTNTITITDGQSGAFIPSVGTGATGIVVVTPTSGSSSFTFTYNPPNTGIYSLSFTNNTNWNDINAYTYTAS